jgi:hypothetical protein
MTSDAIITLLREAALELRYNFNPSDLQFVDNNKRSYSLLDFPELKRDIIEAGRKIDLLILEYQIPLNELTDFFKASSEPILLFRKENDNLNPIVVQRKRGIIYPTSEAGTGAENILLSSDQWLTHDDNEVFVFVIMPYKSVISDNTMEDNTEKPLPPMKRLYRLLTTEKKDIAIFYCIRSSLAL